jgi:hypothetical protein
LPAEQEVVKRVNKWAVLTVAFVAFAAPLYPVFLEVGFPSPSLCVTGGYEYWDRHFAAFVRECAPLFTVPYGKPYGLQLIVDRFYMWGIPWLNSLLAAALCAFLGALLVTIVPQPQALLQMSKRIRFNTEQLHT